MLLIITNNVHKHWHKNLIFLSLTCFHNATFANTIYNQYMCITLSVQWDNTKKYVIIKWYSDVVFYQFIKWSLIMILLFTQSPIIITFLYFIYLYSSISLVLALVYTYFYFIWLRTANSFKAFYIIYQPSNAEF